MIAAAPIDVAAYIRDVPDFPIPGILFKDISPLLLEPRALDSAVGTLAAFARTRGADVVLAAEARGFILGGALADRIDAGFVPARKPGKLPSAVDVAEYTLEYGVDRLEVHTGALDRGARVLVHDDLLATGGTAEALCRLAERAGSTVVGCAFVVELAALDGRNRLAGYDLCSLVNFH